MSESRHTPTPEQMEIAVAWLEFNEGEGDEGAACQAVAAWLLRKMDSAALRAVCKERGISVRQARAAIAKASA